MAASGKFSGVYSYIVRTSTWEEYAGGVCNCVVSWESSWQYGNTHSMTLTVQGQRTDGTSASLWGHITVDGVTTSLGNHNYPGSPAYQETFEPITISVETDDYGNLLTEISIEVGFQRSSSEQHYARVTSSGVVLEKPQKSVSIDCPEGIVCTINKSPLYVDDQFVITVTVTGLQWSDSPIISVTGATKVKDLTYKATGDVYIVITGVLAQHSIHITKDAGMNVTVKDASTGYMYGDGSVVDHYTVIKVECSPKPGYKFNRLTINGAKQNSGVSVEVTSDVNIIAISNALGMARIHTGTKFEPFHIFIFDGASWNMYIPLVYDGVSWNICA